MATRFSIQKAPEKVLRDEVYVLRDEATGAEARIAPSFGCNLYSYRTPVRGQPLEIFVGPKPGATPGYWFGTPILFPWPSGIRAGRFTFDGQSCQVDVEPGHNAMHGLVNDKPWQVERAAASEAGASLTGYLSSQDHPDIVRQFPFPFRIAATYTLDASGVRMDVEARNVGPGRLPMGFATHPWFPMPIAESGTRASCLVKVPARGCWEFGAGGVPTGQIVPPPVDFRELNAIGSAALDGVYTQVEHTGGTTESILRYPAAGAEIVIRADSAFREWVVYAPRGQQILCLEPYTCTTDAFNLAARGIDGGMVVVEPGQSWRGTIWVLAREA